ncbi:MAG TPA: hypothetical protein PJ992_00975 [Arachnia sp.]|nr:hypothetical protein [Arachnia sp.]
MGGFLVVVVSGAVWLAAQFLRDRGSVEHLLFRTNPQLMPEIAGKIERAGESVQDLSLLRGGMGRWNVLRGSFAFGAGYLLAALLVALGVSALPVATVLAVLFGSYGAFDNVGAILMGRGDLVERRDGRERRWFLLAVAVKILAIFAACWLYLAGVSSLRDGWTWSAVAFIVGGLALLTQCHRPAAWCVRRGRRHRTAGFALDADPESILLLRSFDDDRLTLRSTMLGGGIVSPSLPTARVRFEELLVWILKLFGPVVAIGRPGEGLPELGAVRTYWSDDQWQDAVRQTAMRCRGIVLIAGSSEGLKWEMDRLRAWGLLSKTLVVLPPDTNNDNSLRRFDLAVEQLSPAGTAVRETYVQAGWTGLSVEPDGRLRHWVADGRDWAAYAATLGMSFSKLKGEVDSMNDGEHALLLDRLDRAVAGTSTAEDLDWLDHEPPAVPPPPRRKRYKLSQVERPTFGQAARLAQGLRNLPDLDERDRLPEAIAGLDGLVAGLDPHRTPAIIGLLLTQKGELARELQDFDLADAAYLEADRIAGTGRGRVNLGGESWTPEEIRADALRGRRAVAHARGDVEAALRLDDEVAELCDQAGDRAGMLDAASKSAELLLAGEDHARAVAQFSATIQLARSLGDTLRLRWAFWHLANLEEKLGDLDASLANLHAAAEVAENRGEAVQSVRIRLDAARVLLALGRPGEAGTTLAEAARWAESVVDDDDRDRCVRGLLKAVDTLPDECRPDPAELRAQVRDIPFRHALGNLQERLKIAETAENTAGQAAVRVELATRLAGAAQHREAVQHWAAALELARALAAADVLDEATQGLAAALGNSGDINGAVRTLMESSRRKDELGDIESASLDLVAAGDWYLRSERWDEGLAVLDRAWASGLDAVRLEARVSIALRTGSHTGPALGRLHWRLRAEEWLADRGQSCPENLWQAHIALAREMAGTDPDGALGEIAKARAFTASTRHDGKRLLNEWANEDHLAVRILTDSGRADEARSVAAEAVERVRAAFEDPPEPQTARWLVLFLDLQAARSDRSLRRPLYEEILSVSAYLSSDGEQSRDQRADWQGWAWRQLASLSSGSEASEFGKRSADAYRFCARLGDARATLDLGWSLLLFADLGRIDRPDEAYLAAVEGMDRLASQDGAEALEVQAALAAVAFDLTRGIDPDSAEQFARIAVQTEEARRSLADSPEHEDGLARALVALGDSRVAAPRLASVAAYASAVMESEPGNATDPHDDERDRRSVALTRLGRALRVAQPGDATILLREALARVLARHEQRPRDISLWFDLATVLHNLACAELLDDPSAAMGHWSEARAYVGLVCAALPDSPEASELRQLVESHVDALSKASA